MKITKYHLKFFLAKKAGIPSWGVQFNQYNQDTIHWLINDQIENFDVLSENPRKNNELAKLLIRLQKHKKSGQSYFETLTLLCGLPGNFRQSVICYRFLRKLERKIKNS